LDANIILFFLLKIIKTLTQPLLVQNTAFSYF